MCGLAFCWGTRGFIENEAFASVTHNSASPVDVRVRCLRRLLPDSHSVGRRAESRHLIVDLPRFRGAPACSQSRDVPDCAAVPARLYGIGPTRATQTKNLSS